MTNWSRPCLCDIIPSLPGDGVGSCSKAAITEGYGANGRGECRNVMCSAESFTWFRNEFDNVAEVPGEVLNTVARGGVGSVAMSSLALMGLSESLVMWCTSEFVPSLESEESLSMIRRC